jgi:metal-responsive CopG/Arc/MetJ family transcriptional regulator
MAVKVTLTLPKDVVAAVDDYVAAEEGLTRSGVCAEAVRQWLAQRQELEIARYYETMSEEERSEDAEWASLASRDAERLWR